MYQEYIYESYVIRQFIDLLGSNLFLRLFQYTMPHQKSMNILRYGIRPATTS